MTLTIGDVQQNLRKMSAQSTLGDDTPVYMEADISIPRRWRGVYLIADLIGMSIQVDSAGHEYCLVEAQRSRDLL